MRLFFALWPPPPVAARLAAVADSSAREFGGRPTRLETIHLTLAFLGEVPEERLPLLMQSAATIAADPFVLTVDCLGYWSHKQLLWAGSSSPSPALAALASDLRTALSDAGFVIADEQRALTPHITLVRKIPRVSAPDAIAAIDPIGWRCSGLALVRSRLSPDGSRYQTIRAFPCVR